jgi:hypothetical protein
MPKITKQDWKDWEGEFYLSNYQKANDFLRAKKGLESSYLMTGFARLKTTPWNKTKKNMAKQNLITAFVDSKESNQIKEVGENAINILSKRQISQKAMKVESDLLSFIFDVISNLPEAYNSGLLTPRDFLAGQGAITNYLLLVNKLKGVDSGGEELADLLTNLNSRAKKDSSKDQGKRVVESDGGEKDGQEGEGSGERGGSDNHKQMVFVTVQPDKPKN